MIDTHFLFSLTEFVEYTEKKHKNPLASMGSLRFNAPVSNPAEGRYVQMAVAVRAPVGIIQSAVLCVQILYFPMSRFGKNRLNWGQ